MVWLSGRDIARDTIQLMLDQHYVDAWRRLHPGEDGYTFPTWDPHVRLDYMFVPAAHATRVRCCDVFRADGTLEQITRSRAQVVTIAPRDPGAARQDFERLAGVVGVEAADCGDGFHTYRLELGADGEIGEAVAELVRARGWRMRELKRDDRSLEQVFRELTASAAGVAA